jgi:predicted negative regulator of RcsB-dependent stress response
MNENIKKAIIAVVIAVAAFFGFKVTIEQINTATPIEQVQSVEAK